MEITSPLIGKGKEMSVFGILGIIFIVLKVLAIGTVAAWSWWLVLLPFYGGFAIWLLVMLGVFLLSLVAHILS